MPLAEKIREFQESCGKTYGYRRVHIWLERNSIYRNPKTIAEVQSFISSQKKEIPQLRIHKYKNLLNRNFHADRPNQKWVTDILYIHTKQGVLYLSIIRNLCCVQDRLLTLYFRPYGQLREKRRSPQSCSPQ